MLVLEVGEMHGLISEADLRAFDGGDVKELAGNVLDQESGVSLVCAVAINALLDMPAKAVPARQRVREAVIETVPRLLLDSWNRADLARYALDNGKVDI